MEKAEFVTKISDHIKGSSHSKISKIAHVGFFIEEQVLELSILMDIALTVHILQGCCGLDEDRACATFRERT